MNPKLIISRDIIEDYYNEYVKKHFYDNSDLFFENIKSKHWFNEKFNWEYLESNNEFTKK